MDAYEHLEVVVDAAVATPAVQLAGAQADAQLVAVEGLGHEVIGASLHPLDQILAPGLAGQED